MTPTKYTLIWSIIIIVILTIATLSYKDKARVANSALENTSDYITIKIDQIKSDKQARTKAYNAANDQDNAKVNNLCNQYKKTASKQAPHDKIIDWTCK